jgi:formylglycine-generating enzyme required for sulfatase activity
MKTQSTFTSAGWDFVGETISGPNDIWRMCVDHVQYPLLSWQFIPDFTCPDGVDFLDLAFLLDRWLAACDETNNFCNWTDINHDAQVDFGDFAFFARHWLEVVIPQDMVLIPGGEFQMGDSKNEGYTDELPVHTVTLDSFYMGKYEITNQQYCAFLNWADDNGWITVTSGIVYKAESGNSYPYCETYTSNSYSQIAYGGGLFSVRTKGGRSMANDPMAMVRWYGAAAYCNWRSQQEGKQQCYNLSTWNCDFSKKGYRLATEAEWEYGARGGLSGRRFPWGDNISHSKANYYACPSCYSYDVNPTEGYHPNWDDTSPYTSPVGSFPVTGYGLCDMAGNVWEWCNDWWSDSYYSSSPTNNPTGPASGSSRVFRRGAWDSTAYNCRVAYRSGSYPTIRDFRLGFRLVLDF